MPLQYQQLFTLQHPSDGHSSSIACVTFSPDGMLLASGGMDGRVCVWEVNRGKLLYSFSGRKAVLSLVWLPQSHALVGGMEDGALATFTISEDTISVHGFWAHGNPVERLAFNGLYLASGACDEVKVWSQSGTSWIHIADIPSPPQNAHNQRTDVIVTSLHWTSCTRQAMILMITYMRHGIVLIDAQTWRRMRAISVPGTIADASMTSDGRFLAISNMLTGFELYAMQADTELEPLCSFQQEVADRPPIPVIFVHGDSALLGGTTNGQLNLWEIYSRRKQPLVLEGRQSVLALAAHYRQGSDEFFIATGAFNESSSSPVVIWKAKEVYYRRSFMKYPSNPGVRTGLWNFIPSASGFICSWIMALLSIILASGFFVSVYHNVSAAH